MDKNRARLRRESFDEVAELYALARPAYPRALVDELTKRTALGPGSRVLEVGCGTGLMTLPIAETGASIVALELGAHLAEVRGASCRGSRPSRSCRATSMSGRRRLRRSMWCSSRPRITGWTQRRGSRNAPPRYGPAACWRSSRRTGAWDTERDRFSMESQACYARWDPGTSPTSSRRRSARCRSDTGSSTPARSSSRRSCSRFSVERMYTTAEYRRLMETWSAVLTLEPVAQEGLLACIAALIDARFGGSVVRTDTYSMWLARRAA